MSASFLADIKPKVSSSTEIMAFHKCGDVTGLGNFGAPIGAAIRTSQADTMVTCACEIKCKSNSIPLKRCMN